MITYLLKRRALQLWGNTSLARKWLNSVETLGDNWVILHQREFRNACTAINKLPITREQKKDLIAQINALRTKPKLTMIEDQLVVSLKKRRR